MADMKSLYKQCSSSILEKKSDSSKLSTTSNTTRKVVKIASCDTDVPPEPKLIPKCEYYCWRHQNFLQRHVNCKHTPPDYYIHYGLYYCRMFSAELYPKLSDKGKDWLQKAKKNLQDAIEDGLEKDKNIELDSERFRKFAFDSHPDAYWNAGLGNLDRYFGLTFGPDHLKIMAQPDLVEWIKWDTWKQAADVGTRQIIKANVDAWKNASEFTSEAIDEISDYFMNLF